MHLALILFDPANSSEEKKSFAHGEDFNIMSSIEFYSPRGRIFCELYPSYMPVKTEKSSNRMHNRDLVSSLIRVAAGSGCVCVLTKGGCVGCVGCPGGSGGDLDSRSPGFVALVLLVTTTETLIT